MFYLKNSSILGNWYVVQKVTTRNIYDLPRPPLIEDEASSFSDIDAYQEGNSSDAYVQVQFNGSDIGNPMHRPDVESIQIAGSSIMAKGHCNLDENTFINDDNNDSSSSYSMGHEGSMGKQSIELDDFSSSMDDGTTKKLVTHAL